MSPSKTFKVLFLLMFITGCDVKSHRKPEVEVLDETSDLNTPKELVEEEISENLYNLGDEWSRVPTKTFHTNHNTVLRADVSSEKGIVSANFILLDKINVDEALFLATIHSLSSSCKEEGISFLSKDNNYHAECTEVYSMIPGTDAVIFSVKFYDYKSLENLVPISLTETKFSSGEQLRFYGIDSDDLIPGYFPLVTDSSDDCRLISESEKKIFDPDKLNTINDVSYWSLAVTCDVKHGDSGGMLVNRENELVGVLWTGSFPKKTGISSHRIYEMINEKETLSSEERWSRFNYIVPGYRILEHLRIVKASQRN